MSAPSLPEHEWLDSLRTVIATSSRDWSLVADDAWIYGIVEGWGDAIDEVAKLHPRWTQADRIRLVALHAQLKVEVRTDSRLWAMRTDYPLIGPDGEFLHPGTEGLSTNTPYRVLGRHGDLLVLEGYLMLVHVTEVQLWES